MKKVNKVSLFCIALIGIVVSLFSFTATQSASPFNVIFLPLTQYQYIGEYVTYFVFWASILLFVYFIVLLLISLFAKKKEKEFLLKNSEGQLVIQAAAIRSLVRQQAEELHFLQNPQVNVKLSNKRQKISCKISGSAYSMSDLPGKSERLSDKVEHLLENMLGVHSENVDLNVLVKAKPKAKKEATKKQGTRVV
ncbi:alkaline shock response membrane anchor protein AmaP [Vagococcus entomophilus]|uniref:Alkaline shock response membrane anchor protein AmaP n=1 Tax=Vagococcus entomophilus TaxID=1160095 RepID=A0A430AGY1_9ENTE|nr:alkaline shock response membrane anchor protein AmaP [Vagococcus entomophilus]RSU07165.1 hypothetical protein CBF30_07895 [Vagococcus entomophilus]